MLEIKETDFNLDVLLQETLELTEFLQIQKVAKDHLKDNLGEQKYEQQELFSSDDDTDYLMDLADSVLEPPVDFSTQPLIQENLDRFPDLPGIIYRIDESGGTFCVRGYASFSIRESMKELGHFDSSKRPLLKIAAHESLDSVHFFKTKTFELAESIRENIINRRFPKVEDSVCNIADPGFSWWMDVSLKEGEGRFEIFFKSHGVNRAEKYIQLGPIGDGAIAALRLNQARTLLRSSFPITEFVCTDRSFTVVTNKPDHLSFLSFKNIFLLGENHTEEENFPDNTLGRTLYFYFHEIAVIRKFWIEVQNRLS